MSDDLNAEIKIGADASGVEAGVSKAKRSLKDLGDSAKRAGKDAGDGMGAVGDGGDKAAKKMESATRSMQNSLQRVLAEQRAGAKGSREYWEALADSKGVGRNSIKPILDQIDAAKAKTLQAKDASESWTASLGKIGPLVATAFAGVTFGAFLGKVVSVQREFDVLNSSLKTVTGSSAAAEREMAWLKDFAKSTPFGLAQATQGFVKMKALGLDPTRAALTSFGNTASAMGKDLDQMIEAVADASTGEFERLKEFGIKASKEKDKVSLTFQGVTKTIGGSAAEITKYLEDIGNASFGGAMEERAKTLDGTIAGLGDSWDELFRTVSSNNVGSLIFDAVTLANGAIEDATTILRAFGGATQDATRDTGALAAMREGAGIFFETVAVMAANTLYVLRQTGDTLGGLAAGYKAFFSFDFDAVRAIGVEMRANAENARKEIDATTARILNARKEQALYASYATRNASAATDPRRVDLPKPRAATSSPSGNDAKELKAYNQELEQQKSLIAELSGLSGSFYKDWDSLNKQYAQGRISLKGLEEAQAALLAKQPAMVALAKEEAEVSKARVKAWEDEVKAAQKLLEERIKAAEAVEGVLLNAREEERAHQLAAAAGITHAEAIARLALARADENYQKALSAGADGDTLLALQRETDARRSLIEVMQQKGVREANEKAADEISKEWEKTSQLIGQTLSDYIMGGGKDAAQYLKRLFATLILQPVVQYGVNSVMGALGMGQQGSAVQSVLAGGNVGSKVLNNAGAIGAGYQAMYGASVGASSASLFGANAVGLAGGDAMGALIAGNGMWAGVAAGAQATAQAAVAANLALEAGTAVALEAGTLGTAIGTGAAGAAAGASSMMAGVMAAAPYLAAVVALYAIISGLDDSGTPHSGAGAVYSKATGVQSGAEIYNQGTFGMGHRDEYNAEMQAGISGIAQGLGQTLDSFAVSFGKAAGYSVATAFADDSSKDGSWGSLKIADELGKVLVNWEDSRASKWAPREFADGKEGYEEYLKAVAVDVKAAFLAMDLPEWSDSLLKAATDLDSLNAALQQIATVKSVFDGLGKTMGMFADLSGELQTQLLAASGGIEALGTNAGAFYQSFYSEGDRAQTQRELQMGALGDMGLYIDPFQGDAAKEMFRLTVEEAMASGQVALAGKLLAMSASFAETADYGQTLLDATATAAKDAAQEAAAAATSWTGLGKVLAMFSGLSAEVQSGLVTASGGMDSLVSNVGAFNQGFYSEGERALSQRAQQMAALAEMGLYIDPAEGDKAKELFRSTVEGAMASGQTELAAKLLAMSGEFASTADYAKQFFDDLAQSAVQSMSGAWSNFGTMAGLAAQYTGNTSGLSQQLGVVQGSYASATTTDGRVAALQQIINLEQGLWNGQQAARQAEAAAATARANAAREQVNAAKQLLSAAQGLGSYAKSLGFNEASGLGEAERLAALDSERRDLLAKARAGDTGAMQDLQGVTGNYLTLAQQMAVSQQDYSVLSGRIAAELAATAAIQEASATSQVSQYERQIAAAESVAASTAEQFKVSAATQKLIDDLLVESATAFETEATLTQKLIDQGGLTVEALKGLPAELSGAIGASLIPAIAGLAGAVMDSMRMDGSHAGGLSYVPFDGYRAELHMGERVLTAAENRSFRMPIQAAPVQQANKDLELKVERLEAQMGRMADATEKLLDITDRVSADGNANATELMNIKELAKAIAEATAPAIAKAIAEATA